MLHSVSDAQHVSGHRDVDAWHCAVLSRATAEAAAAREEEERGNAMKVRVQIYAWTPLPCAPDSHMLHLPLLVQHRPHTAAGTGLHGLAAGYL